MVLGGGRKEGGDRQGGGGVDVWRVVAGRTEVYSSSMLEQERAGTEGNSP